MRRGRGRRTPLVTVTIVHAVKRCPKCERTQEICGQVAAQYPGQVEIRLVSADAAPPELGVVMPPTVFVDDAMVTGGSIPRKARVQQVVAQRIAAQPAGPAAGEGSAFGHGQSLVEDGIVYICAGEFGDDLGCEPLLLFWHVDEGQHVEEGQELAEVETAKAVFVIECPVSGTLESILLREGEPVGSTQRLAAVRPD